ncbi:MAG: TIGR00282 family metallophosphoesterase [Verrucomicrobiota bacterium]|nr:TIGR00282 family metallophosphoesterase [Verrucomicrobiota bacterium]
MKILLIGDIVGKGGRRAVSHFVPKLKKEYNCCFCIANGENMAGGSGLTAKCARSLLQAGVDVITSGDHVWDQKDFVSQIEDFKNILRPANVSSSQPGLGYNIYPLPIGGKIAVINLLGQVFMGKQTNSPFEAADVIVKKVSQQTNIIFVDFHAEATSEKIAMGRFLDGRVTAVFGTHTHVETADEKILKKGTAYQTDLGMVGAVDSVLGRDVEAVIHRFLTGMPAKFSVIEKGIKLCASIVDFDIKSGRAKSIQRIVREFINC